MSQYQGVFKRYEQKYLLNPQQFAELKSRLRGRMTEDEYGLYTICNLYLDTDDYTLIRTSIDKPVYKEKIRLRSYGVPSGDDKVFLELKKKYKGVVYKRRVSLKLQDAKKYLINGDPTQSGGQIFREIDWSMRLYHRPEPKVFIAYDRAALFGNEDNNLRITFDSGIRWRDTQLDLSKGDWGETILEPGQTLMEIKIPGTMPLWLSHMLSELGIYMTSFSKYGVCYEKGIMKNNKFNGGIICA
jgi:SPX domain protein involved in polyphosphate accumulation